MLALGLENAEGVFVSFADCLGFGPDLDFAVTSCSMLAVLDEHLGVGLPAELDEGALSFLLT